MTVSPVNQEYIENIPYRHEELPFVDALEFYQALDAEFGISKKGKSFTELAYTKLFTETNTTFPGIGIEGLKDRLIKADDKAYEVRDQVALGSNPAPDRTDYKISGEDQIKILDYVKRYVQLYADCEK